MVIRADLRNFWRPTVKPLKRGARAMLVVIFVTLVWALLRFEVVGSVDSPFIELLLLILGLLLISTWILVLLFGLLAVLLSAGLLAERLESADGVVVHRGLLHATERVAIAKGARLRCSVLRAGRPIDVLQSADRKSAVVASRRVFGDRLDMFWASVGLEPEPSEPLP